MIAKLKSNKPLGEFDMKSLEEILWKELGTMRGSLDENRWGNLSERLLGLI